MVVGGIFVQGWPGLGGDNDCSDLWLVLKAYCVPCIHKSIVRIRSDAVRVGVKSLLAHGRKLRHREER